MRLFFLKIYDIKKQLSTLGMLWKVPFVKDDPLCDIQLDDWIIQITAPEDGHIKQRKFKAGDLISNADTLAYFIASKNITMSDFSKEDWLIYSKHKLNN
jgi:hypothetical protein